MTWLRYFIPAAAVAAIAVGIIGRMSCEQKAATPAPAAEAQQKVAETKIPVIRSQAKTERRAARAQVDKEVRDAADAGSLADYLRTR